MTINKPCRIRNKPIRNIVTGPVKTTDNFLQVIRCEEQDRYIWSIRIPGGPKKEDRMYIRDGTLYITRSSETIPGKERSVLLRFPLPADTVPEMLEAFRRPYGFKILLSKRRGKGKIVQVCIQ